MSADFSKNKSHLLVTLLLSLFPLTLGEERGNETGKVAIVHGSVEFCEATSIGLADESKECLYGRETDRDLRSA